MPLCDEIPWINNTKDAIDIGTTRDVLEAYFL
jgi:hypothetical protein